MVQFRLIGFGGLAICTNVQIKWSCQQKLPGLPLGEPGQDDWARPKSIILKGQSCNLLPMPIRVRHILMIVAISLAGLALSGCGTINEKLSAGMGDYIPQWAGGLPPDVPPRPGTAKYDEYIKERERKRLMPASERSNEQKSDQSSLEPVH
jgi:hypothetical protein